MPLSIQYSKIQSYVAECACSFIFGFTVYSAILTTTLKNMVAGPILVGLSIGFVSIVIIFLFVDVTLAHFNPAITFAAIVFRRIPIISGFFYIIAQGIGFMIASLVVQGCFPGKFEPLMNIIRPKRVNDSTTGEMICIEMFLTGILVFSVFVMAINPYKKQKDERDQRELHIDPSESKIPDRSRFAPIVIGLTLGFLGYLGGSTSGGAFNPGIVWAPVLFSGHWGDSWKYWVGEFVGGCVGAFIQIILFYPFY
ncbi:Major Intrinsic Protein (MIP) Family [Trachipleistophora hominis]|uniref:Aquaporin n=1 Tax=Trachipleistophora hominis TaxID=72359 RepID=L7K0H5_TRAHO|nr:Major Intrinsic Protein (MIP) Family [Trachipleistophora hominis]